MLIRTILLITLVFITNCQRNLGDMRYKVNNLQFQNRNTRFADSTLAVTPFSDRRGGNNIDRVGLAWLPLVPYGYGDFDNPEMLFAGQNYRPMEDFAKSLVAELQTTEFFKETDFAFSKQQHDYYIKGTILSTKYKIKLLAYGLSVGLMSWMPWFLGAPMSKVSTDLSLILELINSKTGEVIFAKKYAVPMLVRWNFVYSYSNDFNYPKLLGDIYKEFVVDLNKVR